EEPALGGRRGWGGGRHAGVDAGLLGRPGLAFRLVLRLPLRRLTLLRVHERLRQAGAAAQQEDTGHRSRPRPSDRHSHRLPPCRGCGLWSLRSFRLEWRWIGLTAYILGPYFRDLALRAPFGFRIGFLAPCCSPSTRCVARARIKSVDGVAASRHAGAERAVVIAASLRQRALLPRHVRLLLLLLLLHLLLL